MNLKRRWRAFCRQAGRGPGGAAGQGGPLEAGAEAEAFAELDRRYREPGRHYHAWAHVAACLRLLDRARPGEEAQALELALWFHDAVYRPGRQDNEELSAELALRWAAPLGLRPGLGRRAAALILATRHREGAQEAAAGPAPDAAELLIRDIDLAVLGRCRAGYQRYERGIAREYAGLPPARFREGRASVLRGFLARPSLYATPRFRRRYEKQARRNLARALARLSRR